MFTLSYRPTIGTKYETILAVCPMQDVARVIAEVYCDQFDGERKMTYLIRNHHNEILFRWVNGERDWNI